MNGTEPDQLRIGHLLLEPGNPAREEPPHVWAVTAYAGRREEETVTIRNAGFGEAEQRKISMRRIPPGWLFIHNELLAGLLTRHAAMPDPGEGCQVCAVFGGPGSVETIQKAGH